MHLDITEHAALDRLNSFGVACRARYLITVRQSDELDAIERDPRFEGLPRLVLGGGSNVLLTRDFDGVVLKIDVRGHEALGTEGGRHLIDVGAGENWHETVAALVAADRPGLENLALIPGSVGAAPIQNIGAYGLELAERLDSVLVWDRREQCLVRLSVTDCEFGYRDSVFKRDAAADRIVVSVRLALPELWQPVTAYTELANALAAPPGEVTPQRIFDAVCVIRRRKLPDPAAIGNAGSFFKNPVVPQSQARALKDRFPSMVSYPMPGAREKLAAGWLIDACGLKGATRGRAGVYEKQALVLVNRGGATGAEILALAREVQEKVREKFGVALEPEPVIV